MGHGPFYCAVKILYCARPLLLIEDGNDEGFDVVFFSSFEFVSFVVGRWYFFDVFMVRM